jgi:lysozyme family protein
MPSKFELALPIVLKHEGGYVNDPADPGGPTNYGISLRYLKSLIPDDDGHLLGDMDNDGDIDADDIRLMTPEVAAEIYKTQWWNRYKYYLIENQELATKVLDMSINMGAGRIHKIVQEALNLYGFSVKVDGILGPITYQAINATDPKEFLVTLKSEIAKFYRSLNRPRFIKGWLKRAYA